MSTINKLRAFEEVIAWVKSGATVAIQGAGGGAGEPTALIRALRERFEQTDTPRDLRIIHSSGLGSKGQVCGLDLLALSGLVRCDIAGHLGMAPRMAALIAADVVECYNWPQGVISQLFRAIAARSPGVFTKTGLNTFIDPRLEGGRMNKRTTEDLVRLVELGEEEWLHFPSLKIDVAFIRGTTADLKGNISAEDEAAIYEGISIAQAARACGGIVVAQVQRLAETGTLNPREVVVPGVSVDYVVVDETQQQTMGCELDGSLSGSIRCPAFQLPALPLDERKVVARRAVKELVPGAVINVGVGIPDGIASVAAEQGRLQDLTFTIEQGLVGGVPATGVRFGVSHNPEARIHQSHQFDFYDGGGLDIAFLGFAQVDGGGNVNVSKIGSFLPGCGGFINISQNSRKVVFCGTFTAKGLAVSVERGGLVITQEGQIKKFVSTVEQVTFSARNAALQGQEIMYITERAVLRLIDGRLEVTEIAPGVDLDRDVLAQMEMPAEVSPELKLMDANLFLP